MASWSVAVVTPTTSGAVTVPSAPGGVITPSVVVSAGIIPAPTRVSAGSGSGVGSVRLVRVITRSEAMGEGVLSVALRALLRSAASGSGSSSVWAAQGSSFAASGSGTGAATASASVVAAASGSGSTAVTAARWMSIDAAGSGSTAVGAAPKVSAAASGSGAAVVQAYDPASTLFAAGSGSGTTTATASAQYSRQAMAFGEGVTNLWRNISAAGSGSGSTATSVRPRISATASGSGSGTLSAQPSITAAASGNGTTAVAAALTTPMGLSKTATQTHTSSASAWRKQTGWSVRAGFPSTQLVDDQLVVKGSGSYRLVFHDVRNDSHSSNACRVVINGTVVATSTSGNQDSVVDVSGTLNNGDVIEFQSFVNTVGTAARISNTSTYVELTTL